MRSSHRRALLAAAIALPLAACSRAHQDPAATAQIAPSSAANRNSKPTTVVMIRRGEDLITLRITGVDDPIRRIKLVYGAIDAKL